MAVQRIEIKQTFNAPANEIFSVLTDHEAFGRLINTNIKRVVDAQGENKNAAGSVRRINMFPAPPFEESVIEFEQGKRMKYVVSKGSPLKNHFGEMVFSEDAGKTMLVYTIEFQPKIPFPFWGPLLKKMIENSMQKGLKKLAVRFEN